MGISITVSGDFSNTSRFLNGVKARKYRQVLQKYGQKGVDLLQSATPIRTGATASSWDYQINQNGSRSEINWTNSHTNKGIHIAIIIQYGHGTSTGGYVNGIDYINPAMRPLFDTLADDLTRELRDL